jgi:K+-transporting ATPase ATPase C chain
MSLKKILLTSVLYTLVTAVVLGLGYPLLMTGVAHLLFANKADGQLITQNGKVIGSALIGQSFTGDSYFHSRPSAAGTGYDASSSGGSNLGPASKALQDRIAASAAAEHAAAGTSSGPVPVDLVTASASGLDPDITPAAALYQVVRVARARHLSVHAVDAVVRRHITERQLGLLGEPRVNVLALNLDMDRMTAVQK